MHNRVERGHVEGNRKRWDMQYTFSIYCIRNIMLSFDSFVCTCLYIGLLDPESLSSEWDKTKIQYVKLLHHLSMLLQDKE